MYEVNYLALVLSSVASMIIGMIWYGPLFGEAWMKEMGFTKADMEKAKKKGMAGTMFTAFVSWLVLSYFAGYFIEMAGTAGDYMASLKVVGAIWLGFIATVSLGSVLWENKSVKLYILNNGYDVVTFAAITAILTYV